MKRFVALLALLAVCVLPMCAAAAMNTPMDRFMADWTQLFYAQAHRMTIENDAFEAIETFGKTCTWEDLVWARGKVAYATRVVKYYSETELQEYATEKDYKKLTGKGMDIGDVAMEYNLYNESTLEMLREQVLVWSGFYTGNMEECVYEKNFAQWTFASAKQKREFNLLEMKYLYLTNNFIMLELPKGDAAKLEAWCYDTLPQVMALYSKPFGTTNDVLNEMNRVIDAMEDSLNDMNELTTIGQNSLENINFDELVEISGLPEILPYPSVLTEADYEYAYYWKDAAGNMETWQDMDENAPLPNCMALIVPDASPLDYSIYLMKLENRGFTPERKTDTSARFLFDGGKVMTVSVEDGGMLLNMEGGLLCLAPDWYTLK